MKSINKNFGLLVRNHRLARGFSQGDLAKKLGYTTPQFVSIMERGESKIPLDTLGELIVILGLPEKELHESLLAATEAEITRKFSSGKKRAKGKR